MQHLHAKEFLAKLNEKFDIKIFTTRNKILESKWVQQHKIDVYIQDITDRKDLCYLYIDDRCINFNGNYQELSQNIDSFQPWYKTEKISEN